MSSYIPQTPLRRRRKSYCRASRASIGLRRATELYVERGEDRALKVRLIDVRLFVGEDGSLKSELLAMKL